MILGGNLMEENKVETKIVEKNEGNPFEMQIEKSQPAPENKTSFWSKVKKFLSYVFID